MVTSIPTTGLHGVDFYIDTGDERRFKQSIDLKLLVAELFNLSVEDFKTGSYSQANERGFRLPLSYKNRIMVYFDGYGFRKGRISFSIKGSAFDEGLVVIEGLQQVLGRERTHVSELHAYADDAGDILKFSKLLKAVDPKHRHYTSKYVCKVCLNPSQGKGDSITFGSVANKFLQIYEKGRKDPHCFPLEHMRCELQYKGQQAQLIANEWIGGKELGILVKEQISGMVQIKDLRDKDKNPSRIKELDPMWSKYLDGVAAVKYVITKSGRKDVVSQIKSIQTSYKKQLLELGPEVFTSLALQALAEFEGNDPEAEKATTRIEQYLEHCKEQRRQEVLGNQMYGFENIEF